METTKEEKHLVAWLAQSVTENAMVTAHGIYIFKEASYNQRSFTARPLPKIMTSGVWQACG